MKSKKSLVKGLISITILLLSLIFTLIDALVPLKIWTHPILNFLFCNFIGFGIFTLVLGFKKGSVWFFFLSSILLGLAFFYALVQYVAWWLCLLIVSVVWIIFAILSFMSNGSKTEDISLNKDENYKTFEQRKAEEKEKESSEKTKEELPEIKSFKD